MPSGRALMLTGAAMVLLSMFGSLWGLMTYGLFDPSPPWIAPVLVAGGVGGLALLIFGVIRLVIQTLRT